LSQIDQRLEQLLNFDRATSYSKQKDSLKKQLESFVSALPGNITLATVTPRDICRFLIFKDRNGKTQVHCNGCPHLGKKGKFPCPCPFRLSYNTVDSYIGKLCAIFHSLGRDGEWDKRLALGNPAADKSVKDYLRLVTAEQLQARITPKQATPFFVDKLTQLCSHLERKLLVATNSIDRFIIARDQAFFKMAFFSGDRPGDMGQIKVPEILRFPNDDGLLFNHVWGKTLRDGDKNVFGIRRNEHKVICPINGIERYIDIARQLDIDLTRGYLFHPLTPDKGIQDSSFSSSAAEARLKGYLQEMHADQGETLHGFRAGCAITLALSGADLAEIMEHVGWSRRHTAVYYMQLAKVLNPQGASAKLASHQSQQPSTE
jgi:integrase